MIPATERGRAAAVAALQQRREANRGKPRLDNASLPAGSPMTYYCIGCGADIVVPENWLYKPSLCTECTALDELGWME
jgi:hypothetical protein